MNGSGFCCKTLLVTLELEEMSIISMGAGMTKLQLRKRGDVRVPLSDSYCWRGQWRKKGGGIQNLPISIGDLLTLADI